MCPHSLNTAGIDAAPIFAALGDGVRLSILSRLQDGRPRSLVQLTNGTGLTRQGIRKHLRVLEEAGLVAQDRVGRECRFIYQPYGIEEAKKYLDRASEQWDQATNRLRSMVEGN